MARTKKYTNNTTEALIDAEMELYSEFEEEEAKSPAKEETNGPETKNGIVICALNVNVRKLPDLESDNVIEIIRKNDKVKILDKVGDFYKVHTSTNNVGYVHYKYLKEED